MENPVPEAESMTRLLILVVLIVVTGCDGSATAEPPRGLIPPSRPHGLGDAPKDSRRPPDHNDPMVSCRLGGSISFMLKSGCVNRRGTVIASKGVPH